MNNKRPNYYNSREWNDFCRWFQEKTQLVPPSDFLREMMAHRRKTGRYRRKDLTYLLGDPTQGPSSPPAGDLEAWLREKLCGRKPKDPPASEAS